MAEVEMTDELKKDIVDSVIEGLDLDTKLETVAENAAKAAAEAVIAKFDKPIKKTIEDGGDGEGDGDGASDFVKTAAQKQIVEKVFGGNMELAKEFAPLVKSPYATMTKERRFFLGVKALMSNDQEKIKELNAYSGEMYAHKALEKGIFVDMAEKAGYANDAVSADGGALVPDPEFNTTVYENLPKYGVIFADGNPQSTDRTAVYALSLTGTLAFTNVAEAGAISGTKLTFNRGLQQLLKYAAIIPATEELTEDSIIDYWNLVTNEVSRAYGLVSDNLVFNNATSGILHTAGIITQPVTGAGTSITWDDLLTAEGKLEDGLDTSDFKWNMRKETFYRLAQIKASTSGVYLADTMLGGWRPNPNQPTTPWGTPVRFVRVLPKSTEVGSNAGLAVFGDLKNYNFYHKNGMAMTMLQEATITDANGQSFNLATQDGFALRAIVRILGILPVGNASKFVVLGTGTVS